MRNLLFFTTNFPFGKGEEFIETEIMYLAKYFSSVVIVPLVKSQGSAVRPVPHNVKFRKPIINTSLDKKFRLLLLGLFNTSPFLFAIQEFFEKKVFKKRQWIFNWLSYTCITRAGLSSSVFKKEIAQIQEGDILYFYWADNSSNLIPFLRKKIGNKIVVRFHGGDLYEERKGNYLPYRVQLLKSIDMAVFISQHGKNYLECRYPNFVKKAIISRLGVLNMGISKPGSGHTLNLISCSALSGVKRLHLVAQALMIVDFNVHWTHFGTGALLNDLLKLIESLPENITVNLKGQVSNQSVIRHYLENPVDLFINVSSSEGLPVSVMEAISLGIPVLATNVGGVSEIVSNANGYLIPEDSTIEYIADKLKHFYFRNDKNALRTASRKTWEEKYNAETNYELFCQIICDNNNAH